MIGTIIIAAGESGRLARPKPLVSWRGKPLVRHLAEEALQTGLGPVTVVLSAVDGPCRQALGGLNVEIVRHEGWSWGIGGSIAAGMRNFEGRDLRAVIVMPCDQPLVTQQVLDRLQVEWFHSGARIVASHHGKTMGPPVLFSADCFERLAALQGPDGVKSLIRNDPSVSHIECPEAAFDVDTLENLSHLDNVIPMVPSLQQIREADLALHGLERRR